MAMAAALMLVGGWPLAEPAHASDWIAIGQSSDKSLTTFVDAASLRVTGSSVRFFAKSIVSTPATKNHKKETRHKQTPTAYSILEETVDCQGRTLTLLQWLNYGRQGQVLSSGHDPYPIPETVIPDSMGEATLNIVCGATQN